MIYTFGKPSGTLKSSILHALATQENSKGVRYVIKMIDEYGILIKDIEVDNNKVKIIFKHTEIENNWPVDKETSITFIIKDNGMVDLEDIKQIEQIHPNKKVQEHIKNIINKILQPFVMKEESPITSSSTTSHKQQGGKKTHRKKRNMRKKSRKGRRHH